MDDVDEDVDDEEEEEEERAGQLEKVNLVANQQSVINVSSERASEPSSFLLFVKVIATILLYYRTRMICTKRVLETVNENHDVLTAVFHCLGIGEALMPFIAPQKS